MRVPKSIAVDLTPLLPGGENGGAKIFILELLRRLFVQHPETRFVLLAVAASREDLATLSGPNVRHVLVAGRGRDSRSFPSLLFAAGRRLAGRAPARLGARLDRALGWFSRRRGGRSLLNSLGIDLLFCPFTAPTYDEPGVPTVSTIYDLQYKSYPQFFSPEDSEQRDRTFLSACRHASALVAISEYARQSAITHGKLASERIRTIYLRMAQRIVGSADAGPDMLLARLRLEPGEYLIYPANFWKHKNHEMLLTAFGIAVGRGLSERLKLVCTGAPGERRDWLLRAASALGLGGRVVFPGFLPDAELAALMKHARGLVFPSLYEGFGLPIVEAMAIGVPVACSNTSSLPEIGADAALQFDPKVPTDVADAMLRLASDGALRSALVEAGHRRAGEFSDIERMVSEYWETFCDALDKPRTDDALRGVYEDGWAGTKLSVQIAPAVRARSLELDFAAPDWVPVKSTVIAARRNQAESPVGRICVAPGADATMTVPVDSNGGLIEISIEPGFVPQLVGLGPDSRRLSLLLRRCRILGPDDSTVLLYPRESN